MEANPVLFRDLTYIFLAAVAGGPAMLPAWNVMQGFAIGATVSVASTMMLARLLESSPSQSQSLHNGFESLRKDYRDDRFNIVDTVARACGRGQALAVR